MQIGVSQVALVVKNLLASAGNLKDDAVKSAVLNIPANLENSAVATGLEKGQLSFQSKKVQFGSVQFCRSVVSNYL